MNAVNKIIAKKEDGTDARYCGEFMTTIPEGIVDKKLTGCGLSSVAIENQEPTILVVPTVQLIKNKVSQYPNDRFDQALFGFYSGHNNPELLKLYVDQNPIPKILVTYDSFYRVVDILGTGYTVIVDEFSEFLDAYSYRYEAINKCREYLNKFKKVSYISATPIKKEFLPNEMQNLTFTEIIWENSEKIRPYTISSNHPYSTTAEIIKGYLNTGEFRISISDEIFVSDTAYFFLNSVTEIAAILHHIKLPSDKVKIICADRERNHRKLRGHTIGNAPLCAQDEKPINFVTSCAFKGVDFYSERGISIVVSNSENPTTLVSIDTDIKQIIGRIRNRSNPHQNKVIHIHNKVYEQMHRGAKERLLEGVERKKERTGHWISLYKNSTRKMRLTIADAIKKLRDTTYLYFNPTTGTYEFDNLAEKNELRKHQIWESYQNGYSIRKEYENNDMKELYQAKHTVEDSERIQPVEVHGLTFRELCEWYNMYQGDQLAITPMDKSDGELLNGKLAIERESYIVKEAFEVLGYDQIERLGFNERTIKNILRNLKVMPAIKGEIRKKFRLDQPYLTKTVKSSLLKAYGKYGLHATPKGQDLRYYFEPDYSVVFKTIRHLGSAKAWVISRN